MCKIMKAGLDEAFEFLNWLSTREDYEQIKKDWQNRIHK